jgi:hypothetical protein
VGSELIAPAVKRCWGVLDRERVAVAVRAVTRASKLMREAADQAMSRHGVRVGQNLVRAVTKIVEEFSDKATEANENAP